MASKCRQREKLTKKVGEIIHHDRKITLWKVSEFLFQVYCVTPNAFIGRRERGVESGTTYHHVHFVFSFIFINHSFLSQTYGARFYNFHIAFEQTLQISRSWGHSTTTYSKRWGEMLSQILIVIKLVTHHVGNKFTGLPLVGTFEMILQVILLAGEELADGQIHPVSDILV